MNKVLKICIWENIASPHQSFFFKELSRSVDLQVRYIEKFHDERLKLGWKDNNSLPLNEMYVEPNIKDALSSLEDWKERIHIIPGISYEITQKLVDYFIKNNVRWCHWSERSGIGLAKKLNYNVRLFNLLQPIVSKIIKRDYAKKINKYALGAFSQGDLAKKDFIDWGIKEEKIENLFYTVDELCVDKGFTIEGIEHKKVFMYVGSLYKLKGIEELIISFSKTTNNETWYLLLIGNDKSDGYYKELVEKLGFSDKVLFLGSKPINEISNYINASDVFILPSLYDGWGAVLNEASQLGKALISSTQCGSAHHIIKKDKNGILTKAGNINSLKNAMQYYIDNPKKIEDHGKKSKEIYYAEFTPEKNVERFLNAINKWTKKDNKK